MSKITKAARGQQCTVMLDGVCNFNHETVVFCHYRDLSLGCGAGFKPSDLFGAFCCSSCHDALDGRSKVPHDKEWLRNEHRRGVFKTQKILLDEGLIKL